MPKSRFNKLRLCPHSLYRIPLTLPSSRTFSFVQPTICAIVSVGMPCFSIARMVSLRPSSRPRSIPRFSIPSLRLHISATPFSSFGVVCMPKSCRSVSTFSSLLTLSTNRDSASSVHLGALYISSSPDIPVPELSGRSRLSVPWHCRPRSLPACDSG